MNRLKKGVFSLFRVGARVEEVERATSASQSSSRFRRAVGFIRPFWKSGVTVVVLTLFTAALGAMEPLVMKAIFDVFSTNRPGPALVLPIVLLALLTLSREVLGGFGNWLTWQTRLKIQYRLLDSTIACLYRLPQDIRSSDGVGAIMTRFERGTQGFVGALTELVFNVLPPLIYLIIAVFFMIQLDWRLTLIVLVFVPLPGLIAAQAAPTQIHRERNLLELWAGIYARFHEVLSGLITVRAFAMENAERERFLREVNATNSLVSNGIRYDTIVGSAQNIVVAIARVSAIGFGAVLVLRGEISVGTLVAFIAYLGGLFGPVQGLTGVYRSLRTASVAIDQIYAILDTHEQVSDLPNAEEAQSFRGEVSFEGVTFAYKPNYKPILEGIELHVRSGETVAVVGGSGAGKTTLMALLQRFYDPDSGTIRIDGRDIREFTQVSLRQQIGVVLQEPVLFNDTVRNNIAYGNPHASKEAIEAAAQAANADAFICRLPSGYDTVIGERGSLLSTGERQRLAIARALVKNPPIFILDEATSALDVESEALVQEALDYLMKDRTTFVIAHRLSTIAGADRIVVLSDGRVVESGTHTELLQKGGFYASLIHRYTRMFRGHP